MQIEMESLKVDEVWELVELFENRSKVIGSKWVFRVKTDTDGKVETHKNVTGERNITYVPIDT